METPVSQIGRVFKRVCIFMGCSLSGVLPDQVMLPVWRHARVLKCNKPDACIEEWGALFFSVKVHTCRIFWTSRAARLDDACPARLLRLLTAVLEVLADGATDFVLPAPPD